MVEDDDCRDQLWWDESPSVSQLVSPEDSAIYTLSFLGGGDGLSDVGEWSVGEKEDSVFSDDSLSVEDVSSTSQCPDVISTPSPATQSKASSNTIDELISFVRAAAPAGVYNAAKARRRKKRRCDKAVVPELRAIWRNVKRIFAPFPKPTSPGPNQPSYTLDWSNVNSRFVNNLPKPRMFPKLGCSQDPSFYDEDKKEVETGKWRTKYSTYHKENRRYPILVPNHYNCEVKYGEEAGYMTHLGVIPWREEVYHGHIYDKKQDAWILHAKRMEEDKEKHKSKQKRGATARPKYQKFARPPDTRSTSRACPQGRWSSAGRVK